MAKKPKLESKEEPVINYGNPPNVNLPTIENLGLSKVEKRVVEDFEFPHNGLLPQTPNGLVEEPPIENDPGQMIFDLEEQLEEARISYQKLFAKYQELSHKNQELSEKLASVPTGPTVNPTIVAEFEQLKNAINTMYVEFQNESVGNNPRREIHDVIFLTGQHGLISKFKKSFPFLQ